MSERKFIRRRYSKTKKVISFSERNGMPYKYNEMVIEPDTGIWLHKSESDGKWNRVAMDKKPQIPGDPQALEHVYPGFDFRDGAEESFFS